MINVINYHITSLCNYHCKYCFVGFDEKSPAKETAFSIIEAIHKFFVENGINDGRINFAGGEPLLYPHLTDVIEYANSLNLKVSIITNGSLLTEKLISNWQDKVETIGISIDASKDETNCVIGRDQNGKTFDKEHLFKIADCIHENGIKLKINTVVSKLNLNENMFSLYKRVKPDRLKFLCLHVLDNINCVASMLMPTKEEFESFVTKNKYEQGNEVVVENEGSMQNSYLMISPCGNVFLNESGEGKIYGNCLTQDLCEIYQVLPFDKNKYNLRY